MPTTAFTRYARWVLRHRIAVGAAVLLVTLVLGRFAGRLEIEVDPDKQVPEGHPYITTLTDVYRIFGDKNLVVVGLFPNDGRVFTPAFLAKVHEITRRLSQVPGAHPALTQSLAAQNAKDVTGTADAVEVRRLMETPPATQAEADEVRRLVHRNDAFVGTLVTADDSAAAVQASFELTPATPDYRSLHRAIVAELEAASDGTFEYKLAGLVVLLSELSRYAAKMAFVFPVALLVIALVHFDAFRTFQGLVLPMVTAILAVLWALGLMGLFGIPLDPLNTTTPILILAVAAGHAVQVLKRFYEEYEKTPDVDEAIVACLAHVGPVMVGAGLVATLSFWSLVTFQTASIRTFGLFAGLGIVSALVIEMTIIPVVRSLLPPPRRRERERQAGRHVLFDPLLGWAARMASTRRATLFAAVGALVVVFGLLAERVEVKTSLREKFRASDTIHADDTAINDRFAGTNTLVFLVEGPGEGSLEDPRVVAAIDGLSRSIAAEPGVGKVFSYVDVLARLHQAVTADEPAAPALPDTPELVAQYLFLHALSGGGDMLGTMIDPTHRVAKVRVLAREDSTAFGEALIGKAKALVAATFPPGYRVRYTGTLASTAAATEVMVRGKMRNIAQVGVITFCVAALLLRSFVGGLFVVVPLVLTVVVGFGTMGLLGVPLDTMTAATAAMAVGIGADYAMYFLFRVREEVRRGLPLGEAVPEAIRTSGKAVLFVSSAVACGYATLAVTGFSMHVNLGLLVALAMVVSASSTVVLVSALALAIRPRFLAAAEAAPRPEPELEGMPLGPVRKPRLGPSWYDLDVVAAAAFVALAVGLFVGGGFAAAAVATSSWSLWARVPLTAFCVLVAAHGGHLLGFVAHEGIHLNLAPNKYASVLLGSLCGSMVTFMAIGYGVSHWSHHRFTNGEQDPDAQLYSGLTTFWSRFFRARLIGSRSHTRNTLRLALGRPLGPGHRLPFGPRAQRWLAIANLAFLASWWMLYAAIAVHHPLAAFVGILLPLLVLLPVSGLRGYVEHAGTDQDALRNSRSWAAPLYTVLFFGNNLHLEHHLYPGVPCYRLPRLHRWLAAEGVFARAGAHVDATVLGPWRHALARSPYPLFRTPERTHVVFGAREETGVTPEAGADPRLGSATA